ncbi:hypothetical protein KRIGEM_02802 [Komagataeibacter rhaeticus]|nr:hypothetical protein KRIGEM_02802 [Komagataeibacter rhaeticus]
MTSITTSLTTVSYQSQSSIIRRPQTAGYAVPRPAPVAVTVRASPAAAVDPCTVVVVVLFRKPSRRKTERTDPLLDRPPHYAWNSSCLGQFLMKNPGQFSVKINNVPMPCSTSCHTRRPMSSMTADMPRTNSVNISGTGDLVLSFRQGRMIQKSSVPDGLTDTGTWSKTCGQGSRNGGLSRPDMRRPPHPSSPSSSSLLQQTISRSNKS